MSGKDSLAKLIDQNPRDARVCHDASAVHLKANQLQDALNTALKAVDLGIQAKKPNPWHIRHCARVLIEANFPGLALDLIERSKTSAHQNLLALQKARALRSLRREAEALKILESAERSTDDAVYKRQLRNYRMGILSK
ncbi:MAG: hypothetical protein M9932_17760 [Xanthobacteraceae bacterium]|nr:hypothetical protein [Xanthobacteraceae bacterium]